MFLRLSEDARESVLTRAAEEMHCAGASCIGTDHMLLGVLHDPASGAADALRIDVETARAARATLDRVALAAVGIAVNDLDFAAEMPFLHRLPPLTSGRLAKFFDKRLNWRARQRRVKSERVTFSKRFYYASGRILRLNCFEH